MSSRMSVEEGVPLTPRLSPLAPSVSLSSNMSELVLPVSVANSKSLIKPFKPPYNFSKFPGVFGDMRHAEEKALKQQSGKIAFTR